MSNIVVSCALNDADREIQAARGVAPERDVVCRFEAGTLEQGALAQ